MLLTPNEKMTWKEMVKRYPDMWVIVEKTKGNPSTIEEGIVRFVVDDKEMSRVWIECQGDDLNYVLERTTVASFVGIIDGVNFTINSEVIVDNDD